MKSLIAKNDFYTNHVDEGLHLAREYNLNRVIFETKRVMHTSYISHDTWNSSKTQQLLDEESVLANVIKQKLGTDWTQLKREIISCKNSSSDGIRDYSGETDTSYAEEQYIRITYQRL